MEKKQLSFFLIAEIVLACTTALFALLYFCGKTGSGGNYTDEMKLEYTYNYNDEGANDVERTGDHKDSPYFSQIDFYNAKPTDTISLLPQFKTIQQTSWWSCGVCSVMMVLDYYDCLGDMTEKTLADLRSDHSEQHPGTCLDQMLEMLEGSSDLVLESTYDHLDDLDAIDGAWFREQIEQGYPIIIGWNDWGGHWQVMIGYDDMGTEDYFGDDVIVVADPFDSTDHNQDGYGVYGMERLLYNFSFYDFFPENHLSEKCFIVVKPHE